MKRDVLLAIWTALVLGCSGQEAARDQGRKDGGGAARDAGARPDAGRPAQPDAAAAPDASADGAAGPILPGQSDEELARCAVDRPVTGGMSTCTLRDAPASRFATAPSLLLVVDGDPTGLALALAHADGPRVEVQGSALTRRDDGLYEARLDALEGVLAEGEWTLTVTAGTVRGWALAGPHTTAALATRARLQMVYPEYMRYFSHEAPQRWLTAERQAALEQYLATAVMVDGVRDPLREAVRHSPTFRAMMFAMLERRAPVIRAGSPGGTAGLSQENGDIGINYVEADLFLHELTHSFHRIVLQVRYADATQISATEFVYQWMYEEDFAEALVEVAVTEWISENEADRRIARPRLRWGLRGTREQILAGEGIGAPAEFFIGENPGHFGWWLSLRFPDDPRLQNEAFWALTFEQSAAIAREHGVPEEDIEGVRRLVYEYQRPPRNQPIGYPPGLGP